jgi:hypothetical protein
MATEIVSSPWPSSCSGGRGVAGCLRSPGSQGIAPQLQLAVDQHLAGVEVHVEFDAVDEEGRRCVILAVDALRGFAIHRGVLVCRLARQ